MEPLSGYLLLAEELKKNIKINGEAFNFGPSQDINKPVLSLIKDLYKFWPSKKDKFYEISDEIPFDEAQLLKLNCDKALFFLKWKPTLNYEDTIKLVGNWYSCYYNEISTIKKTEDQIAFFEEKINF